VKIIIINNLFPPYDRGGAEKVVIRHITELIGNSHQVVLITTKPSRAKPNSNYQGVPIHHLNSHYLSLGDWPMALRPIWHLANIFSWRKYLQLKKILILEKPDLVITHNLMGMGFMTPLVLRQLNIRHEHWLHDIQLLHPSGIMIIGEEKKISGLCAKIYQLINYLLFSSPTTIKSPSQWLLTEHIQRGFFSKSDLQVVSNQIKEINSFAKQPKTIKKFLYVGQLERHKGVDLLISAFKQLTQIDLSLDIIGDGQEIIKLKSLAENDKRIKFYGRLLAPEVLKFMEISDLLVVPSLCYENSPTVIYEAQKAATPVLASNIGGIPEIITKKDRLFQAGDEKDLLDKMKELIEIEH